MNKIKSIIVVLTLLTATVSCKNEKKAEEVTPETAVKKETPVKNVLFVLTSHEDLGETGEKTGFWIEEFASPYYFLVDKGVKVTIASPKGGQPPIDPKSALADFSTPATERYNNDIATKDLIKNTVKLETINPADYDAVFYPGGHGPLWDLAEDKTSIALIENFYNANKPVAFVCHAPAALKHPKKADGVSIVNGKKVTGFSNTEEEAVQLTKIIPFLVEEMLQENGGIYSKGADWKPYALEDGLLITGQNPASSELVAELLLKKI